MDILPEPPFARVECVMIDNISRASKPLEADPAFIDTTLVALSVVGGTNDARINQEQNDMAIPSAPRSSQSDPEPEQAISQPAGTSRDRTQHRLTKIPYELYLYRTGHKRQSDPLLEYDKYLCRIEVAGLAIPCHSVVNTFLPTSLNECLLSA